MRIHSEDTPLPGEYTRRIHLEDIPRGFTQRIHPENTPEDIPRGILLVQGEWKACSYRLGPTFHYLLLMLFTYLVLTV